jgi:hypothetical protein
MSIYHLASICLMLFHISFFSPQVDKWKVSEGDNIKFSPHIAHFLLESHQKLMLEKSVEASIQGIIIVVAIIACQFLDVWFKKMDTIYLLLHEFDLLLILLYNRG